jgi:uncharacterized tellurite resistance protein B-like protein
MFDLLKNVFAKGAPADSGKDSGNEVKKDFHDVRVAACALLLEMAGIDGEFSDVEREHIVSILEESFGMSGKYAEELIAASQKELEGAIDLWQFTSMINKSYSRQEKMSVIETVWKVVYADGKLDKHEDYLVHKLANLLRLTHKELIDAKLKIIKANKEAG